MTGASRPEIVAALARVEALIELDRFAEAVSLLAPVVAADPHDAHGWCLMAQAQLGADRPNEALQAASTAAALSPESEWPHRLGSLALDRLGRHADAIAAARQSARLGPHTWQALTRLSHALARDPNQLDEARAVAERAVSLAPHRPETHLALGAVAVAAQQSEQAEAAFRRALALDPQHSGAHNELARLRLKKGNVVRPALLARAAGGFADALRSDPRASWSRHNLDLVLMLFLGRVAYLVFLDLWLVGSATRDSPDSATRLLPVLVLAVPGVLAARFVAGLRRELRDYLWRLLLRPSIGIAAGLEALAVVLLVLATVGSANARTGLAGVATVAALVGRLILYRQVRRQSETARNVPSTAIIGTKLLTFLAVLLALFAVLGFGAAVEPQQRGSGVVTGLVCSGAVVALVYFIRRRGQG